MFGIDLFSENVTYSSSLYFSDLAGTEGYTAPHCPPMVFSGTATFGPCPPPRIRGSSRHALRTEYGQKTASVFKWISGEVKKRKPSDGSRSLNVHELSESSIFIISVS